MLTLLGLSSSLQCTTKPSNLSLWGEKVVFWRLGEDYLSPEGTSRLRCCLLTQAFLSIIGVILGRLAAAIPWESFRPLLESIFDKEGKSPVGRKHTDVSIMFRLLVLQQYLNCSDMRLEFHVRNNLCLRYFVGLGVEDSVPDANTVWVFRRRIQ